jgi:ABC-type multidrug transport system permease subunit
MMLRGFWPALVKDLRLLMRDRVALVFLTLAPIVVITVAGFSLASLYGADPRGASAYLLPLVDEDGGDVAKAIRERLSGESAVIVRAVESRERALELLERREAGAALVIPAGTTRVELEGKPATLLLLTDPVKYLEIANVRVLVEELRHGIEEEARRRAAERLAEARRAAQAGERDLARVVAEAKRDVEILRARLTHLCEEIEERSRATRAEAEKRTEEAIRTFAAAREREMAERLERELAPIRAFLALLAERQREFAEWLAAVREKSGKLAERIPPPPAPPAIPPELSELAAQDGRAVVARLLGSETTPPVALTRIAVPELPEIPQLPAIELPAAPVLPEIVLPAGVEIEERSVTGAPRRLNTFDQNVPGFSVTFLLLGMLFGVSLSLLDERDWGTLERLRSMPVPFSTLLVAKLASRVLVGMAQMALLFAVGRAAFGISLGPEPWALLLPTAGIVFAGTAFGLVVAGLAASREAVLPIGSIVIVTMAAVGGCWWPIDLEPRWMRSVAQAFPTTWAMAAYNDLMIRRQAIAAALLPTAVLLSYGALYLTAGVWLFRRQGR